MLIDIALLRIVKHRSEYDKLIRAVKQDSLDEKTRALLADFGKYFQKFPEHPSVDMQVFLPRFRQWHPTMTDETFNTYAAVMRNIKDDVDPETRAGILSELYELDFATTLANLCDQYSQGDLEMAIGDIVSAKLDEYKMHVGVREVPWNSTDIADLLQEDTDNSGIRWRLNALNQSMRPLRPGDFGIIAGRPDKGKTTMLTSEVTYMAPQLDPDQNVIWLNNEGPSGRIVKRMYQSALGLTITELVELNRQGRLKEEYIKLVGRLDRIRVVDVHGMHVGQVEAILEQSNPGLVVYDMIDKIRGFGSEARTDLQLEAMYDWARERSVKYNFIGLATSQISADGDGEQFPGLSKLKDSKTGKQGACDFQLMIGASNDENLIYSRFLSLPKNKLSRDGFPGDPRCEVKFKPKIARYEDITDGA